MKTNIIIKRVLLLSSLTLTAQVASANNNIQSVIDSFINCDSSFFYQLKTNASDFNGITDLVVKDDIAYIPVKDVTSYEDHTNYFTQPIKYRGLTITGYQNIHTETAFSNRYSWGFVIDGTIDNVKTLLNQLPWKQYNVNSYIATPLLYDRLQKSAGWVKNPYVIEDVLPRSFTVEKFLYLQPMNDKQVHLVCSLQGDIDKPLLYSIHPDMKDIDQQINEQNTTQQTTEQLQPSNNQSAAPELTNGETQHSEEIF